MLEAEELKSATKAKYLLFFRFVKNMRVRQKRSIFCVLRHLRSVCTDTFLPQFGIHCGEFAYFQILSEYLRKDEKREHELRERRGEEKAARGVDS